MPSERAKEGRRCFGVFRLDSYKTCAKELQTIGDCRPHGASSETKERKAISVKDLLNPEIPQSQAPAVADYPSGENLHEWQVLSRENVLHTGPVGMADIYGHTGRRRYFLVQHSLTSSYRRPNTNPIEKGNNLYGRRGKRRCMQCRSWRQKVYFLHLRLG